MITSIEHAKRTDVTICRILKGGGSHADCVVALANEKERLLSRIEELESIAPRKIKLGNGKVMIWRCPDELVPLDDARGASVWRDKDRLDFFERVTFCAYRVDPGFVHIGLPHGVSGGGLTLREAIDDLAENQASYETEVTTKKEP